MDTNREVRYVQVSEAPAAGWPVVAKTVREADIDKIKDCKEDIDTLLVFAGLYSAVLSAFVIESYKTLQQDNEEVMVGLMQRLVAQNFIVGPGYLNSTTPFPEIPPFEPPTWAIRVNVLWFTSLMLSLAVASFGMLVKQWLREYRALDYAGPRERLCARLYRTPALEKWKVFEIAAILPVLLQISLGLFFVGLCFFTSAVHSSVRSATIPVVAAWAFVLLMTIIAPLFSPRCPFKTTFLKAALKAGRRHVAPSSRYVILLLRYCWNHIIHSAALQTTQDEIRPSMSDIKKALTEERDYVKTEREDVDILTAVDSLMLDDGLLPSYLNVLVLALKQKENPTDVIKFVLLAIGRRIGQDLPSCDLNFILELSSLSKQAWSVTTDAVASTLARHSESPVRPNSPPWVLDAIIILLSHSPYSLSEHAVRVLRDYIASKSSRIPGLEVGERLAHGLATKVSHPGVSRGLLRLLEAQNRDVAILPLINVYAPLLCRDPGHSHASLCQLFHEHISDEFFAWSNVDVLRDFFDLAVRLGENWITYLKPATFEKERKELLYIIMQYGGRFERHADVIRLCSRMVLTPKTTYPIISLFAALHAKARIDVPGSEHPLVEAYQKSDPDDQKKMLINIDRALKRHCDGGDYDDIKKWNRVDAIRLYQLLLMTYNTSENQGEHPWESIWKICARVIQKYHDKKGWTGEKAYEYWEGDIPLASPEELLGGDQVLARKCLSIMDSELQEGDKDQTPPELREALRLFVPGERSDGDEGVLEGQEDES